MSKLSLHVLNVFRRDLSFERSYRWLCLSKLRSKLVDLRLELFILFPLHLIAEHMRQVVVCLVQIASFLLLVWRDWGRLCFTWPSSNRLIFFNMELLYRTLAAEVLFTLHGRVVRLLAYFVLLQSRNLGRQFWLVVRRIFVVVKLEGAVFVAAETGEFYLSWGGGGLLGHHVFLRLVVFFYACKVAVLILFSSWFLRGNHLASFRGLLVLLVVGVFLRNVFGDLNLMYCELERIFGEGFLGTDVDEGSNLGFPWRRSKIGVV